jgi:hypothetical protein
MTKEYKITTSCTLITEYIVEANSEKEAEDMFTDGLDNGLEVDYLNETIDKIEVVNDGDTNE